MARKYVIVFGMEGMENFKMKPKSKGIWSEFKGPFWLS